VLHVRNHYVNQQARRFRIRKAVADCQNHGTIPKPAGPTISPAFHTRWRGAMKFKNASSQAAPIVIDFDDIRTSPYVRATSM
jgi:hypothetical protein